MKCPKCGAQLMANATFCGACGHRLDATATQPMNQGAHSINIDQDSRGQGRGYSYEVLHQPSFSLAVLQLQAEQSIQAEAGAMVSMSANVELQSQMKGGLFGAIKRAAGVFKRSRALSTSAASAGMRDRRAACSARSSAARATFVRSRRIATPASSSSCAA